MDISSSQSCCEEFGINLIDEKGNEIKFVDYIGCKVLKVGWSNNSFKSVNKEDGGDAMVNIVTSKGIIQINAYNIHNGYYTHDIRAKWMDYEDIQEV